MSSNFTSKGVSSQATTETIDIERPNKRPSAGISPEAKRCHYDETVAHSVSRSNEVASIGEEENGADAGRNVLSIDAPRQEEERYVRYEMFYLL